MNLFYPQPHPMMNHEWYYAADLFDHQERRKAVDWCVEQAKLYQADAIAGCGLSGSLAVMVADRLDCGLILVRKATDDQHHMKEWMTVQASDRSFERVVIVDDFVSTGATVKHIVKQMADPRNMLTEADVVAVLSYSSITRGCAYVNVTPTTKIPCVSRRKE